MRTGRVKERPLWISKGFHGFFLMDRFMGELINATQLCSTSHRSERTMVGDIGP